MAHHAAKVVILATGGLASALNVWTSIGASATVIILAAVKIPQLLRRNSRRRSTAPTPPALGAGKAQWELYAHLLEQHLKDQEGANGP